jgi:hypothetical protein
MEVKPTQKIDFQQLPETIGKFIGKKILLNKVVVTILIFLISAWTVSVSAESFSISNQITSLQITIPTLFTARTVFMEKNDEVGILTPFIKSGYLTLNEPSILKQAYQAYLYLSNPNITDSEVKNLVNQMHTFEDYQQKVDISVLDKTGDIQNKLTASVSDLMLRQDNALKSIIYLQISNSVLIVLLGLIEFIKKDEYLATSAATLKSNRQ